MCPIMIMDEIPQRPETPQARLKRYKACLDEFEQMQYSDAFTEQIKEDIAKLEREIANMN
ncbi:hypothetical protein [Shewanella youngdeokensis]|uniref:Uncharacterized protein n=1 Tax=Shewanella youngdeokensis TaxID=2999068 RepID=A0ABZ0K0P0_9GAMM|nr:hypothetical protein RGE70_00415 [Shewanella sp. DAU334]